MHLSVLILSVLGSFLFGTLGAIASPAGLFRRQGGGGGGGVQNGGPPAGQQIPSDFVPWSTDPKNLTLWGALLANPSFGNLTSTIANHSSAVVSALNDTLPTSKLTIFAPYDGAWAQIVTNPFFLFANSTAAFDPGFTQFFAYHATNATNGSLFTNNWPAHGSIQAYPSLMGANLQLSQGGSRPNAPSGFVGGNPSSTSTSSSTSSIVSAAPTATPSAGPFWADDAMVIFGNVTVANGIIHVVDRVMNPAFAIASTSTSSSTSTSTASSTSTSTATPTTSILTTTSTVTVSPTATATATV
ncbi:hypothetical protein BC828DRAFT_375718 [Blastocladiella britannica]|nr:hypothetical protein BC828DRAFT_375718 [Blastocladiella britannica]